MISRQTCFLLFSSSLAWALPRPSDGQNNTTTLTWAPCNLDFPEELAAAVTTPIDCANLEVPLDYTSPESKETIQLQLIRVSATQEPAKGSIIFNPGGPGGSGVEEIARYGPMYRDVFEGQYNIIGFDTR